jgi:hypothetical protein
MAMKNFVKLVAGLALVALFAACSQQAAEEPVAEAPMETAEEFLARANAELEEPFLLPLIVNDMRSGTAKWWSCRLLTTVRTLTRKPAEHSTC